MPLPEPKFDGDTIWDGTTPTRPNTDIFKRADGEIGGRHSSEIIALEETVKDVLDAVDLLLNPGAANSILGVKNDQSDLEYKVLTEGTGIDIVHATETITISATPPEDTTFEYTSGKLTTVTRTSGTKTLVYSGDQLQTISDTETQTLSTFGYTGEVLTSITVTPL
jgi:hypothetical protein